MAPPLSEKPTVQESTQDTARRLEMVAQNSSDRFASEVYDTLRGYKTQTPDTYQQRSDALFRQINDDMGGDKKFPGLAIVDRLDREITNSDDHAADFSGVSGVSLDANQHATGDTQLNGTKVTVTSSGDAISTTGDFSNKPVITTAGADGSTKVQNGLLGNGGWTTTTQTDGSAIVHYGQPDAKDASGKPVQANPNDFKFDPKTNKWTGPGAFKDGRTDVQFNQNGATFTDASPNGQHTDKTTVSPDGLTTTVNYDNGVQVTTAKDGTITWRNGISTDKDGISTQANGATYEFHPEPGSGHWGYVQQTDHGGTEKVQINANAGPNIDQNTGAITYVEHGNIISQSKSLSPDGKLRDT